MNLLLGEKPKERLAGKEINSQMEKQTLTFMLERETKNTIRYAEYADR
jgi:hypothetical protein